jgi:uncharacterized protein YecE (DUF72 family)
MAESRRVKVGTAGWQVPAVHRPLVGSEGSVLARYAARFPIVEVNTSFYRPHASRTWEGWAAQVPAAFRFSAKLPRTVSHDARLQGCGPLLDRFRDEVSGLGRRLGGLLLQLPPSLVFEPRVADTFLAMLRRRFDCALACEPRHASWFAPAVDRLWTRHEVARVAADPALGPAAALPGGSGKHWRYWRLHGAPRMYYSRYEDTALDALAAQLKAGDWVVFDNTAHGHALGDAARLQDRRRRA